MSRPGSSLTRLTDLGNAVDEYARDPGTWRSDDADEMAEAIRHAIEGLTRTAQAFPQTADGIEVYVTRMAAALRVDR